MIGKKAEAVLNRAVSFAVKKNHEYFTLEHVLWSLLEENDIQEIIHACDANLEVLKTEILQHLDLDVPKASPESDSETPVATASIQRLIQRALFHVQSAGKDEITPSDLFVALFQAKDTHALYLLQKQGLNRLDVISMISHGGMNNSSQGEPAEEDGDSEGGPSSAGKIGGAKEDPLKLYTVNLNERARKGEIDPVIGRVTELERVVQTLCRRRKNNPLLVGEAGVGKTAIAEGLALRIVEDKIPTILKNAVIYSLEMGSLVAGTKFRGDFEQRIKRILQALDRQKQKGQMPILFIDEIHTVIGAGSVSGGTLDAANLLKPALSRGDLRCLGSTTHTEYRNTFEKDHALARRFQKIEVAEPSQEDAVQILTGLKPKFESHHDVEFTLDAIRSAVELSAKHITDRFLPDKAIDVIDEAGAKARISRSKGESIGTIGRSEIEEMIAQIARIPARSVSTTQKTRLKNLERDLKLSIFGQDHAIDALVTAIRLARSGLRSGDKPVGSFLFSGPTGVGKTELSKQLAHCMGIPFSRFDMSEYSEKHTISRLIGAPPGYVGFEQAGLLTDTVLKNPHGVILLDEIEKAHPEVWNALLQVMDHGTLTDNNGRKVDFRNSIIIMTSNVGSREMERKSMGFSEATTTKSSRAQKAVEQAFTPEFRNRLDAIIYFNSLDLHTMGQVVSKQLIELESQLLAKHVELEVGQDVRDWLTKKGFDPKMGARPLARLIQDEVKKLLADEILFGKLENGGSVRLFLRDDRVAFEINNPLNAGEKKTKGEPILAK